MVSLKGLDEIDVGRDRGRSPWRRCEAIPIDVVGAAHPGYPLSFTDRATSKSALPRLVQSTTPRHERAAHRIRARDLPFATNRTARNDVVIGSGPPQTSSAARCAFRTATSSVLFTLKAMSPPILSASAAKRVPRSLNRLSDAHRHLQLPWPNSVDLYSRHVLERWWRAVIAWRPCGPRFVGCHFRFDARPSAAPWC